MLSVLEVRRYQDDLARETIERAIGVVLGGAADGGRGKAGG